MLTRFSLAQQGRPTYHVSSSFALDLTHDKFDVSNVVLTNN